MIEILVYIIEIRLKFSKNNVEIDNGKEDLFEILIDEFNCLFIF